MSQVLLVIEDETLATLIEVNLDIYTGAEVVTKSKSEEAIQLLELNPNYDVVLCQQKIGGLMVSSALQETLSKAKKKTTLVIYGDASEDLKGAEYIRDLTDMKTIVRTIAKALGITAKDMAELKVGDLYPISLKLISSLEAVPADIYFSHQSSAQNLLVLKKGQNPASKINFYKTKNVKSLYIDSSMRVEFVNMTSKMVIEKFEIENLTSEETLEIVERGIEVVTSGFLSGEISESIVNVSKKCIEAVNDVCTKLPGLHKLLILLTQNQSSYLYSHSIVASYVSDHIIDNISWGGPGQKEKINFIFFFQDMALAPLYAKYPDAMMEEDFLFNPDLSEREREIVLDHAKTSSQLIQQYPKCPMGADVIICQHHGMISGEGFAQNFKDDISPLAKVIIVAESFVEEVFRQRKENGNIEVDLDEVRNGLYVRFTKNSYRKIIDTLKDLKF